MEVKYEITPTDIVVYQKEASKKSAAHVAHVLVFGAIIVLFILSDIILSLFLTITPTTTLALNILARTVTGLLLLGVTYVVLMAIAKHQAKKMSVTGPNGTFCGHSFEIDENGFIETTHVNRNSGKWAAVESIEITENFVTIKIRLCCNYFIPMRAFTTNEELRTFVTTVRRFISPSSDEIHPVP